LVTATERAREFLVGLLAHMGIQAEVQVREEQDRVILDVKGPEAGLIIGKKGLTLDALQYLVGKIAHRDGLPPIVPPENGEAPRERNPDEKLIVVDAEDYRARRIDSLVEMANRLGEKAIRTGKSITVDPMSPHDRRIIHITLDKVPGVTTRSEGEGAFRRLMIIPQPDKL
jgi:spoIIIJ-associated protein